MAAAMGLLAVAEAGALSGGDGRRVGLAILAADTWGWGEGGTRWSVASWDDEGIGACWAVDCFGGPGMWDLCMLVCGLGSTFSTSPTHGKHKFKHEQLNAQFTSALLGTQVWQRIAPCYLICK